MGRKLIVISHDAMVYEDLAYLKKFPTFRMLMEKGSVVKKLRTIYPTVTYPVHTTIMTGVYPDTHGIYNNELTNIGELSSPWHWFNADVKVEHDIFTAAKAAGMTTAAVFWPVTGNHPAIDYLIDEYWSQSPEDPIEEVFARSGSTPEVMEKVVIPNKFKLEGFQRKHPQADEFVIGCAVDIIRNFKPDLLMIHPANVDSFRHGTGIFGPKIEEALEDCERWTGQIIEATKEAGVYEETDFIIMSDHGQLDIKRGINPNVILRDHGFIAVDEKEDMVDWKAFCKSAGMSCQVYLKDPSDKETYDAVYGLLKYMAEEGIYGFEKVYTEAEIRKAERLGGEFSFVLETDGYTTFGNDWRRPLIHNFDLSDYRFGRATHGYHPDKGPQPTFVAMGPSFSSGVQVERRPIVDTTATMAQVLGIEIPGIDGTAIKEILK